MELRVVLRAFHEYRAMGESSRRLQACTKNHGLYGMLSGALPEIIGSDVMNIGATNEDLD